MAITEGTILRIVASIVFPDNVIMQNVFHAVLTTAGGSSDEDDVVLDMEDYLEDLYTEIVNELSDQLSTDEVKVYEYDAVDDDWDEVGTGAFTVTFVGSSDILPHGVAQVTNFFTTDPDVQGRKYFGGIVEDFQDESVLTAGAVTDFADLAAVMMPQFVGTATGATFTPGVWSPTNTNFFAFNQTAAVNAIVGYQRRRKPGVGI